MSSAAKARYEVLEGGGEGDGRSDRRVIDGQGELDLDSVAIPTAEAILLERIKKLGWELAAAKAENTKLRAVDPQAAVVRGRLERWQRKCHPKAKIPVEGKRWKIVKARLADGYTPEQLDAVIDVAAALPFEQFGRRYCEAGPGRVRRDDITFVFADETRVDRLLTLTDDDEHESYRRWLHGLLTEHPKLVPVLALLAVRPPHGEVLAAAAVWARRELQEARP